MASLTPADIAADLKVSRSTALDYIRDGRIPGCFRVVENGPWRVDAEVYAAWRAERMAELDPHRIEPRSSRSKAAQSRKTA